MIPRFASTLHDQNSFYKAFIRDLRHARARVIIESPFITAKRINEIAPILERLVRHGVKVVINTKPFEEHDTTMRQMAYDGVGVLQSIGASVLMTVGHHRKLAIIDDHILWEGSLNILSQNDSCEIMRRIDSVDTVKQLTKFIDLDRYYKQE